MLERPRFFQGFTKSLWVRQLISLFVKFFRSWLDFSTAKLLIFTGLPIRDMAVFSIDSRGRDAPR
jgi:hypothetical protein